MLLGVLLVVCRYSVVGVDCGDVRVVCKVMLCY